MLDEHLADLHGVETRRGWSNRSSGNIERFPADFMFQLTKDEAAALRSQTATSDAGRGGRRYAPYVFTEQGVAMLSGVLRSKRAVAVNIEIKHDQQLAQMFQALRQLISAGPDDADMAVAESIAMATSLHGFRSRPGGRSRGGRGVVGREAALR